MTTDVFGIAVAAADGVLPLAPDTAERVVTAVLDALAAAGCAITDPERGDVIVRPTEKCGACDGSGRDVEAAIANAMSTYDGDIARGCDDCGGTGARFTQCRLVTCATCGGDGIDPIEWQDDIETEPGDQFLCPDCTGLTLARTRFLGGGYSRLIREVTEVYSPTRKDTD